MSLYPSQDSFVRGELSPRLHSRASLDLYRAGLAICENFLTLPHGGMRKRGGTYFVNAQIDSVRQGRGIPFIFNDEQAYCLELGHEKLRVYAYGARVGTVELTTPWGESDLKKIQYVQSADVMWLVHPDYESRKLTRTAHTSWSLEKVVFTDGPFGSPNVDDTLSMYVSAETGTVTIKSDFDKFVATDVGRLVRIDMEGYTNIPPWEANSFVSSGNPLGLFTRYNGNVYECMTNDSTYADHRTGATPPTHTKKDEVEKDGPGKAIPIPDTSDQYTGLDWKFLHSGFGVARIATFVGVREVTALVLSRFPAETVAVGNKSDLWRMGAFETGGYADCVGLFEERLIYSKRFSTYGSKTGEFDKFKLGEKDNDGLQFLQAGGGAASDIVWLGDATGFLLLGTIGGIRALSGSGVDEALTPSSFKNRKSRTSGCAPIQPIDAGEAFIYVAKGRKAIMELILQGNGYFKSNDLGQISEHISKKGIADIAFQEYPDPFLWFPLDNGELGSFTHQPAQEVRGMHRQRLGGSFDGAPPYAATPYATVESVVRTPGQTGQDDVWLFVRRTINGATFRTIEIITAPFEYAEPEDAFQVDCGLTYSGAAVTSVTGASHLIGETVDVLADGKVYKGLTVSGAGGVTLPAGSVAAAKWQVGLPFTSSAETLELDVGWKDGSGRGRRKKVHHVIFSVLETDLTGLSIASKLRNRWEPAKLPSSDDPKRYTGNVRVEVDDSWEGQGKIRIRHTNPTPCTICAMTPVFEGDAV